MVGRRLHRAWSFSLEAVPKLLLCAGLHNLFPVPANGIPNQDVLHNALVRQGLDSDWGGIVLQQPGLQGNPLIGVPISS